MNRTHRERPRDMFLEVLLLVAVTITSEVVIETYSIAILKGISNEIDKKIKDISEAAKEKRQLVRQKTREELKERGNSGQAAQYVYAIGLNSNPPDYQEVDSVLPDLIGLARASSNPTTTETMTSVSVTTLTETVTQTYTVTTALTHVSTVVDYGPLGVPPYVLLTTLLVTVIVVAVVLLRR